MKVFSRITALLMCIVLLLSGTAYADETVKCELYSIMYQNGVCTVVGRCFTEFADNIRLEMRLRSDASAEPVSLSEASGTDGGFIFNFSPRSEEYDMKIIHNDVVELEWIMNFQKYAEIINSGLIDSISFTSNAVLLHGTTSPNTVLTLRLEDSLKVGSASIKALEQVTSDENGSFEFNFGVVPGVYTLHLKSGTQPEVSCLFDNTDEHGLSVSEDTIPLFTAKLLDYVSELETLIAQCEQRDIPTDLEVSYAAIIEKFVSYIEGEADRDTFTRMGQYHYELTKIYNVAYDNLTKYLSGEKKAHDVTKYITTDKIEFDGTKTLAMTEKDGIIKKRPIFLIGWGNFQTPMEQIPLFKKLGMNLAEYGLNWEEIIVPIRGPGWNLVTADYCEGLIASTKDEKYSGEYSIKLTKDTEKITGAFKYIYQTINVKPSTTYLFGCKTKGTGISENAASFNLSINTWDDRGRTYLTDSEDWQEHNFEVTTGATTTQLTFTIFLSDTVEAAYIDDVYVTEKDTSVNLAVNGNFDEAGPMTPLESEMAEKGWYVRREQLDYLDERLQIAEDNNYLVNVSLATSFVPDFIKRSDPDITEATSHFLPYSLIHPTVHEAISCFAQLLAPIVNKYSSVQAMGISNEPQVSAASFDCYLPAYREYLKNKYGTIEKLNEKYRQSNLSFDKILWPNVKSSRAESVDYRHFNDELLTNFHKRVADETKKYCPDKKVFSKYHSYFLPGSWNACLRGTDYELLAEHMDVNGCDGGATYGDDKSWTVSNRMGWYDLLTSISDKPVWDTEHHIMRDSGEITDNDTVKNNFDTDIWNGAVHGRGGSVLWLWEDINRTGIFDNTNARRRPELVFQSVKAAYDLNRLTDEIYALQDEKAKVGVLYSRTSISTRLAYQDLHLPDCIAVYDQCIMNGQKVKFITDSNPEAMNDCELLIVPTSYCVPETTFECIERYTQNGGKILVTNSQSLRNNEYYVPFAKDRVNAIYTTEQVSTDVAAKIDSLNLSDVVLKDAVTGEKISDTEWSYTNYNGKCLVNMVNYNENENKNIKVLYKGREIKNMTELRSDTNITSGVVNLKSLQSQLISFDMFFLDMVDENGTVTEKNISTLKKGTIKCNYAAEGSIVLALYKDGALVNVTVGKGTIDIPDMTVGKYRLTVADWDVAEAKPLRGSMNIFTEVTQ